MTRPDANADREERFAWTRAGRRRGPGAVSLDVVARGTRRSAARPPSARFPRFCARPGRRGPSLGPFPARNALIKGPAKPAKGSRRPHRGAFAGIAGGQASLCPSTQPQGRGVASFGPHRRRGRPRRRRPPRFPRDGLLPGAPCREALGPASLGAPGLDPGRASRSTSGSPNLWTRKSRRGRWRPAVPTGIPPRGAEQDRPVPGLGGRLAVGILHARRGRAVGAEDEGGRPSIGSAP